MFRTGLIILLLASVLLSCNYTTQPKQRKLVVCITFDDNYPSVLENALPILDQYGYRATMFINSGLIGDSTFMSWQQLNILKYNYGWEIGGHTIRHDNLSHLTYSEAEYVIKTDFDSLCAHGFNPVSFATPFGICPVEYYPIVLKYYRNLRTCFDVPMYSPLDRSYIGCFGVSKDVTPQDVENRINQAAMDNENLVVLLFHKIIPGLTYISNYEPIEFEKVINRIHKMDVVVLPLNEALNYLED